jgi:hypothetical protein
MSEEPADELKKVLRELEQHCDRYEAVVTNIEEHSRTLVKALSADLQCGRDLIIEYRVAIGMLEKPKPFEARPNPDFDLDKSTEKLIERFHEALKRLKESGD